MIPRLDELETDLIDRRQRATDEGWHGEIEGIDLTLTFLRRKRAQAQRTAADTVRLGMPAVPGLQVQGVPTDLRSADVRRRVTDSD